MVHAIVICNFNVKFPVILAYNPYLFQLTPQQNVKKKMKKRYEVFFFPFYLKSSKHSNWDIKYYAAIVYSTLLLEVVGGIN